MPLHADSVDIPPPPTPTLPPHPTPPSHRRYHHHPPQRILSPPACPSLLGCSASHAPSTVGANTFPCWIALQAPALCMEDGDASSQALVGRQPWSQREGVCPHPAPRAHPRLPTPLCMTLHQVAACLICTSAHASVAGVQPCQTCVACRGRMSDLQCQPLHTLQGHVGDRRVYRKSALCLAALSNCCHAD